MDPVSDKFVLIGLRVPFYREFGRVAHYALRDRALESPRCFAVVEFLVDLQRLRPLYLWRDACLGSNVTANE
jgi:hypothetical protein